MNLRAAAVALLVAAPAVADQASVLVPPAIAARVAVGERAGVVAELLEGPHGAVATITQRLSPLPSAPADVRASACPDATASDVPAGFAAPAALRAGRVAALPPLERLHHVVAFVTREVALDEHDGGPQDAASVLRRRRARCSGRANAAVGLLRAVGIPARTAHGILLAEGRPAWHRWGEAWLGELGWVPFDPGAAVGAVSVRYLPVSPGAHRQPLAGVRILSVDDAGWAALPRRAGLRTLPAGGHRLSVRGPRAGQAFHVSLVGPGGLREEGSGVGQLTFSCLLPGRYRVSWRGEARGGRLDLDLGGDREIRLPH